jgi:hypothetical protein
LIVQEKIVQPVKQTSQIATGSGSYLEAFKAK